MDINKDGFLSPKEFIQGLTIIFCEEICSLIKFIFSFYDFDYDGFITSEDIHAIMSYIPVINSFSDMIDIEEEIQTTLEQIFVDDKNKLNLYEFTDLIINHERYEIFIPIISFFFEQKPFSNQEINYFYKDILNKNINNDILSNNKQNCYQIEGKINLKIEKDENISKTYEGKIIFDFDKTKFDESNNEYENLGKKISVDNISLVNNISMEKEINDSNPINNIIKNHDNKNNDDSSYIEDNYNNNSKNLKNDFNSNSSYGEHINTNIKVIENEDDETNNNDNNNLNKDNNISDLRKVTTFSKQGSTTSSNITKENYKIFSRQHSVKDVKQIQKKVMSRFANHEEIIDKNDIIEDLDKDKELKEKRKQQFRLRTQSMRNIKYKKENLKDLVSKSKGFKRLQNSIPSLINNTKILAKYSSKNFNTKVYEGLSQYTKGNVIQNLCKSKINFDNENNNYNNERKITEDSFEIEMKLMNLLE